MFTPRQYVEDIYEVMSRGQTYSRRAENDGSGRVGSENVTLDPPGQLFSSSGWAV